MASRLARKFEKQLLRLFRDRTHGLRAAVSAIPGAGPKMTKKKVLAAIDSLQDLAEKALLRSKRCKDILRKDYDDKKQWHPKRGKGYGRAAKRQSFKEWYDRHVTTQNCVYVFWGPTGCLYVGRTLSGKGRPSSHFDKHWFGKATRIDIYGFDRRKDIPRFECMLTHREKPSYSQITPGSKKFHSRCPICDAQGEIEDEIKRLFRLR